MKTRNQAGVCKQSGVSLIGFIIIGILVALAAMVAIKVVPEYVEYYTILKNVKAVANSSDMQDASVAQIRAEYEKKNTIDYTSAISGKDLDITKEGNQIVIYFAYQKKIHLVGAASLVLDFEGSSHDSVM